MAEIPSDIASSAAQAGFQARQVGKEREAHRAGQAQSADRQTKSIDETGEIVETGDGAAQVFTDAEGMGSQGRSTEQETPEESQEPKTDDGITSDPDGQLHVDLEA